MAIIHCCKDCPDRKIVNGVRCHSTCEKYLAEEAANKKRLEEAYAENKTNEYYNSICANRADQLVKYRKRRKYG